MAKSQQTLRHPIFTTLTHGEYSVALIIKCALVSTVVITSSSSSIDHVDVVLFSALEE